MSNLEKTALWAYVIGAVVTFGHAWKVAGIFAAWVAPFWPLYVSVQLWK